MRSCALRATVALWFFSTVRRASFHCPVDVQAMDVDFYCFSGHKLYGPSGIGVLFGKEALLAAMPPYQGGGDMIERVTFERTTFAPPPARFEAGTPPIAGAVGLHAAIDYVASFDPSAVAAHEHDLLIYASETARQRSTVSASTEPRPARPPSSPSRWTTCIPTMSEQFSTGPAWRYVSAIIARSR